MWGGQSDWSCMIGVAGTPPPPPRLGILSSSSPPLSLPWGGGLSHPRATVCFKYPTANLTVRVASNPANRQTEPGLWGCVGRSPRWYRESLFIDLTFFKTHYAAACAMAGPPRLLERAVIVVLKALLLAAGLYPLT
jgi:hypothetical protein